MSPPKPEVPGDRTVALLADPYRFISRKCDELGSDGFETRLLLKQTVCIRGPEAAEAFYDPSRFYRHGAMPSPVRKTLLGEGGVQGLDGERHQRRKAMFLALMRPERVSVLGALFARELLRAASYWSASERGTVVLYDELHLPLTRAVCAWAGVPLAEHDADRRASELRALFDSAGSLGPRHLKSRRSRKSVDRWLAGVVEDVRAGRIEPGPESAAVRIATALDADGELLPLPVAAVELANVLRPTVATAVYITLVAHALTLHPEVAAKTAGDPAYRRAFVQEVRRYYPFFPSLIARARVDFEWNGLAFQKDRKAVLDLYGTNHDERTWTNPERFDPERFLPERDRPFAFIPQG